MSRDVVRVAVICLGMVTVLSGGLAWAEDSAPQVRIPIHFEQGVSAQSLPRTVIVERGDHLWKISERHLGEVQGRQPEDSETHPYWRQVIEINLEGLRSGDPDLIYPGEMVTLPETG